MGKFDDEQALASTIAASAVQAEQEGLDSNGGFQICKFITFRCVLVLLFSASLLLSSLFFLPPFLRHGDRSDLDPNSQFGAQIQASFKLQKSVSLLSANILKLEYDIFEEIDVVNSTVNILSLQPLAGSNWTNVVFGVVPSAENLTISSTVLSVLRAYFVSFVIRQSNLHLTPSLFGNASSFQVLKFPGGITVIPQQNAFLLQKVQFLFNFTLNYPIYQIQDNFEQLRNQLKSGLRLTSYENLYMSLTNLNGSTLAPPVIVQASVLPAVGSHLPPPRLKQLAQTITGSPARNLGLNHTVFGDVNQIRLSSFLNHTLNSSTGSNSSVSQAPSSAPPPISNHHHRHHHHHHHHHHNNHHHHHHHHHHHVHHHHHDDHNDVPAPVPVPAPARGPAPAPLHSYRAPHPSNCRFPFSRKPRSRIAHSAPTMAPMVSRRPSAVPRLHGDPPTSALPLPRSSPLPAVSFAHVQPSSRIYPNVYPPDGALAPLSSSSPVAVPVILWAPTLLGVLLMHA